MTRQRVGTPLRVGGVVLLPLERVTLRGGILWRRIWAQAAVEPAGLAILSPEGLRVCTVEGEDVEPEDALERFDGLAEAAARSRCLLEG